MRPHFATLEKYARFSRSRNFARARRAPKIFWKKFEFIEELNFCKIRTAGKLLVWPENGRSQRITQNLRDMTRKNHIKIFFKVGYKIAKIVEFKKNFDPPKNKKTLGPKSSAIWDLWRHLTFKIDLHPPGTPKPFNKTGFWRILVCLVGANQFEMLNVSINLIWRNFLHRGFFVFRWVKKKFGRPILAIL